MALTAQQKYKVKKFVQELKQYRARHTEFVSVYIPAGYDLNKIMHHLSQEQSTATNIKSAQTRKNVINALERMIQHLKLFKQTPPNGLAVFSGNLDASTGGNDVQVWSIEPPMPINQRIYRCDKDFQLDILEELMDTKEVYGMVVLDTRDAIIAILKGSAIIPLTKTHSHVPGKFKAGGQSAKRFSMNRDLAKKEHLKKVAEYIKNEFLNRDGLKGILIGGPGPIKYELVEGNFITGDIQKKIIAIKDLSYTEEFGLHELLDKCQDILADEEVAQEKKIVGEMLDRLVRDPQKVAYGQVNVKKALEMGAVEDLLISEVVDAAVIDELEEIAKQFNTTVHIISTDTREGVQLKEIGGFGALLRYEV
ncbi:peptide chain release factor 1 [Candidatus Woesearchaeota archaeon]|nr:peptide chain release factor 1 [Candidatus Woesearchaeota archaeon]